MSISGKLENKPIVSISIHLAFHVSLTVIDKFIYILFSMTMCE